MIDRKLLLWLCFLLFLSCSRKKPNLPVNEEKLIVVLADVHLAEAALQHLSGPIKDTTATLYYEQVFVIHGIEKADFDTTMFRLREDPDRLSKIYSRVLSHLDTMRVSDR